MCLELSNTRGGSRHFAPHSMPPLFPRVRPSIVPGESVRVSQSKRHRDHCAARNRVSLAPVERIRSRWPRSSFWVAASGSADARNSNLGFESPPADRATRKCRLVWPRYHASPLRVTFPVSTQVAL